MNNLKSHEGLQNKTLQQSKGGHAWYGDVPHVLTQFNMIER